MDIPYASCILELESLALGIYKVGNIYKSIERRREGGRERGDDRRAACCRALKMALASTFRPPDGECSLRKTTPYLAKADILICLQFRDSDEGEGGSESSDEMDSIIEQLGTVDLHKREGRGGNKKKGSNKSPDCCTVPTPPPYGTGGAGHMFNPDAWKMVQVEMPLAYPIFQDPQGQRYHEPLDFKTIKSLAESDRTYGITVSFTVAQVEALNRYCMTATDWAGLACACLSPGQYLDWRAFLIEFANEEAAANQAAGNAAWDRDVLLGQGRFTNNQTGYPVQVYEKINKIGIKAWKALPNKGELSGNLTKILQGPMEPFSDFVACMVEVAGRIFGDPDAAMPLIKQLVYEQCTKECCEGPRMCWSIKTLQYC
ncbi:hypothetical protein STEG23_025311 [Scotinomys teguina]